MGGCVMEQVALDGSKRSSVVVFPHVMRMRCERALGQSLGLGERLLQAETLKPWETLQTWFGAHCPADVRLVARGNSPALTGGTVLCVGVDEYEESRFQFSLAGRQIPSWSAALSAMRASDFLKTFGLREQVLTGALASRDTILATLSSLLQDHDPDRPFLLWLSGLALGQGARTRFLPWDTDWNHPLDRALEMTRLYDALQTVPHWGLVLDTAWPYGEAPQERHGLIHPLRSRIDLNLPDIAAWEGPEVRTALFVAMSESYDPDVPALPESVFEMEALADVLRGVMGFDDVRVLHTPTVEHLLAQAGELAARAGVNGLFTFGFQGYGMQDRLLEQGFLLCKGADPDNRTSPGMLPMHHLLLRTLIAGHRALIAGHRALILDFRPGMRPRLGAPWMADVEIHGYECLTGAVSGALHNAGILVLRGTQGHVGAHLRTVLAQMAADPVDQTFPGDLAHRLVSDTRRVDARPCVDGVGRPVPGFAHASRPCLPAASPIRVGLGPEADFVFIQAALDAAPPSAIIHVAPGHYRESLVIHKPVTLIGLGNPAGAYVFCGEDDGIEVIASGTVCLRNLILVEEGTSTSKEPGRWAGILVLFGSLVMERCEIHARKPAAIRVNGTDSRVVLDHCRISDASEMGLRVEEGARAYLDGCELTNLGSCAVEVTFLSAAHLKNVRIAGRHMTGICVSRGSLLELEDSRIDSNEDCCVVVSDRAEAFIEHCRFGDGARIGVLLRGKARTLVRKCRFSKHGGHQPWQVGGEGLARFEDNRIDGN